MRISTGHQFESYTKGIETSFARLFRAQTQVQSGKRIERPSDDPYATTSVVALRNLRGSLDQYASNLHQAQGFLGYTESALDESQTMMAQAYQLAVRGASEAATTEARSAMAAEVASMQSRLVELANSRSADGRYLFAGQATDAPPYSVTAGIISYAGDTGEIRVETAPGVTMPINTNADSTFLDAYARLEDLRQNLLNGAVGTLSTTSIPDLQASHAALNLARGAVGMKLQKVEAQQADNARRRDELTKQVSDIEDVDLTQAIMDYRLADTAYQAALNTASQGFGLSLMDFIRG